MRIKVRSSFFAVAALCLGGAGLSSAASALEFGTIPIAQQCDSTYCPRAVIAEGEITAESPAAFNRFLRSEMQVPGLHAVVFINSPGGNVESALRIGLLLHESGSAVIVGRPAAGAAAAKAKKAKGQTLAVVPGQCASACVYALMGAKKRVVPQGARLAVHRMSARLWGQDPAGNNTNTRRIYAGDAELAALRSYVSQVGGSQELISLAESIPHENVRVLSPAEVKRFRLGQPSL